jgi:hypothetical protein
MKTIYSIAFICVCLLGFSSRGQVNETTIPNGGSTELIALTAPEGAVMEVTSNAVDAVTIFWLPDQMEEIISAAPVSFQGTVAGSGAPVALAVPIEEASSNGQSIVRFVYQNSPGIPAATGGLALGAVQGGNSPQPLYSIGACVRAGSGLIGWWQAENNSNDSAGNNPGQTPHNMAYVPGEVGQAFSLNGSSQSVQIPYATNLVTTGLTVEVWINPTHTISSQAFVFGQAYGRQLIVRPGTTGVGVGFLVTSTNGTFYGVYSSHDIPTGQWTHVAGTWNGTNLMLYLNGALDRSSTLSLPTIGNSGCPFSIGGMISSCGYSGQYFPGLIDEVSLYDRALLSGEIQAVYLAGAAGKCKTPPGCVTWLSSTVASWPGEGDASDIFVNNPGVLQNSVSFDQGIVGGAFKFNGSQQAVEIPSNPALLATPFSVEAWVKPTARGPGSVGQGFVYGQSYGRQLVVRNGLQGLRVAFLIATSRIAFYEVDSSGNIPIGEWTHILGTYDGAVLRLFINGALDQQATVNVTPWDSGCPFHIGGIYDPSGGCAYAGQYFNGLIDEVTCYSQALAATDVSALYNAGGAGKCADADQDGLPDWWEIKYFGDLTQGPTDDYDGDGRLNIDEFNAGADPNKIRFAVSVANQYVNSASVPIQLNVSGGVAWSMAVLLDNTNFAAANWTAYNPSLTVNLGTREGWHEVWVGLRGRPDASQQSWSRTRLKLDVTPPLLVVTTRRRPRFRCRCSSCRVTVPKPSNTSAMTWPTALG